MACRVYSLSTLKTLDDIESTIIDRFIKELQRYNLLICTITRKHLIKTNIIIVSICNNLNLYMTIYSLLKYNLNYKYINIIQFNYKYSSLTKFIIR